MLKRSDSPTLLSSQNLENSTTTTAATEIVADNKENVGRSRKRKRKEPTKKRAKSRTKKALGTSLQNCATPKITRFFKVVVKKSDSQNKKYAPKHRAHSNAIVGEASSSELSASKVLSSSLATSAAATATPERLHANRLEFESPVSEECLQAEEQSEKQQKRTQKEPEPCRQEEKEQDGTEEVQKADCSGKRKDQQMAKEAKDEAARRQHRRSRRIVVAGATKDDNNNTNKKYIKFDDRITALLKYKEKYGDYNIDSSIDPSLHRWVCDIRRGRHSLQEIKLVQLKSIGFELMTTDDATVSSSKHNTKKEVVFASETTIKTRAARRSLSSTPTKKTAQAQAATRFVVGTKVSKFFEGHGWHQGEIVSYSNVDSAYWVRYNDGDEESYLDPEHMDLLSTVVNNARREEEKRLRKEEEEARMRAEAEETERRQMEAERLRKEEEESRLRAEARRRMEEERVRKEEEEARIRAEAERRRRMEEERVRKEEDEARIRAEAERRRIEEEERLRREKEARMQAEAEEAERRRMEERLRKAEEARKRAEAERRRMEEEEAKMRMEEERLRKEEARLHAEAAKTAGVERCRMEEERMLKEEETRMRVAEEAEPCQDRLAESSQKERDYKEADEAELCDGANRISLSSCHPKGALRMREMSSSLATTYWKAINSVNPSIGFDHLSRLSAFHHQLPNSQLWCRLVDLLTYGPKFGTVFFPDCHQMELTLQYMKLVLSHGTSASENLIKSVGPTYWHKCLDQITNNPIYCAEGDHLRRSFASIRRVCQSLQVKSCGASLLSELLRHQLEGCINNEASASTYHSQDLINHMISFEGGITQALKKAVNASVHVMTVYGHFLYGDCEMECITNNKKGTTLDSKMVQREASRLVNSLITILGQIISYMAWVYGMEEKCGNLSECKYIINDVVTRGIQEVSFDPTPFLIAPKTRGRKPKISHVEKHWNKMKLTFVLSLEKSILPEIRPFLAEMLGVESQYEAIFVG